ncbi:uncharacterized protein LOC109608893 isoform X2 [Aethina tumida]|uniref:uncharacterized protein LOC109608893 isoform X2 n=1 Tax=Aethina tumida TaxID=116153 RepID=UPI002147262F|nr:uncharacterized protein LOC109608893 isoform X2 [Aethina tumida]
MLLLYIVLVGSLYFSFVCGFPANFLRKIAESNHFDDFENYLPKFGELPKFQYSTDNNLNLLEDILFKNHTETKNNNETHSPRNLLEEIGDVAEFFRENNSVEPNLTTFQSSNLTDSTLETTTIFDLENENATLLHPNDTTTFPPLFDLEDTNSTLFNDTMRFARQEEDLNETAEKKEKKEEDDKEFASQIDEESSEEDENMITGLLGSLLGSLSRPDGSIDLEAITSLLGSLSTQNPDGTYNFDGLTELLMGFFGGGGEEGGSDVAAFLGGLVGAVLKGSAQNPPGGPKGVGLFTGKLVGGILPALSGPQPTVDPQSTAPPPAPSIDSGSFLGGLIKGVLQSSGFEGLSGISGSSSGSSSGGNKGGGGGGSKFGIFKAIFSMITSIFTSSSANKQ